MVDIAKFFLEFTVDESCGKCTPCRIGTKRLLRDAGQDHRGQGRPWRTWTSIEELCYYIKAELPVRPGPDRSQPGALHPAATSGTNMWPTSWTRSCPAGVCKALLQLRHRPEQVQGLHPLRPQLPGGRHHRRGQAAPRHRPAASASSAAPAWKSANSAPSSRNKEGVCQTMEMVNIKINGMPLSRARRAPPFWKPPGLPASRSPPCATSRRSTRSAPAASAWWRSRAPAAWSPPAFTRSTRAWRSTPTPPRCCDSRKTTLELILSTHERSCLSCVRSGNCELQKLCQGLRRGRRERLRRRERRTTRSTTPPPHMVPRQLQVHPLPPLRRRLPRCRKSASSAPTTAASTPTSAAPLTRTWATSPASPAASASWPAPPAPWREKDDTDKVLARPGRSRTST